MSSPAVTAPYTRAVVNAMRKLYVSSWLQGSTRVLEDLD